MRTKMQKDWAAAGCALGVIFMSTLTGWGALSTNAFPFVNRTNETAAAVSNYARNFFFRAYDSSRSNDYQYFRAVFTPASSTSKLAVHSDDGSKVTVNGSIVVNRFGEDTHMTNLANSFNYIGSSFVSGQEYCVEIFYTNHFHTTGDVDGVTLYAYAGGGTIRNGIIVSGDNWVCPGNKLSLGTGCATLPISWSSSNPNVATVNNSGSVTGVQDGTTTITATDAESRSGTKVVTVGTPRIRPNPFLVSVGVTNIFALTNAPSGHYIEWSPQGETSADLHTNAVALTNAGSNIVLTAIYDGACTATATGVVVAASSISGPATSCAGEAVIYTAVTIPPGYEDRLTWSGEGLSGSGAKRTNTYATTGVKVVSVSCGTSVKSFTNTVYRMQITPTSQNALADSPVPVTFTLTNSYGLASWQISAGGASFANGSSGNTVSINPGPAGTNYTLTAAAAASPSCFATAALQVVKVTFSTNLVALCESNTAPLTFSVTPANMLGSLLFDTVTNITGGPSNTSASISPASGSTNLTVNGLVAGTATVRVRLGNTVTFGPVVKTVRVQFPTNTWYVAQGAVSYFGATVTPAASANVVSYASANSAIAIVSGSGTNLSGLGVTNGTTQVQARVGGQTCSAKDLNVVGVRLIPDDLFLCVGQSGNISATITPTNAPVSFTIADPAISSMVRTGNTLTVTSLAAGTASILTWLQGAFVMKTPVYNVQVLLPTQDFYIPEGGTNYLSAEVFQAFQSSNVTFAILDPTIAEVIPSSTPLHVGIRGITNGTTTLVGRSGTNWNCVFKSVTVLPIEKLPLGKSLTRTSPSFFKVYVPTKWGGKLTIGKTAGTITDLKNPDGLPYISGSEIGTDKQGWFTFCIPNSSSYTVTNSFQQIGEAAKRPWDFYYWPSKADYIRDGGNAIANSIAATNSDDMQVAPPGSVVEANADVILAGTNGILQSVPSTDDQLIVLTNLFDIPGGLSKYDAIFGTTARNAEAAAHANATGGWWGHCAGASVASIALNQPAPTAGSGLDEDELEGLWATLGEEGEIAVYGATLMTNCPAGPPRPGTDPTDASVGYFHAGLEEFMKTRRVALQTNLRSSGGRSNEVWNYAIWKYQGSWIEATNGNERIVQIQNQVSANSDRYPPTSGQVDYVVNYQYTLEYGTDGKVRVSATSNDWMGVSGSASWAPSNLIWINTVTWGNVRGINEANLQAIDLNN